MTCAFSIVLRFSISHFQSPQLAGITVGCRTYDREVVGSTPGRVAIKGLLVEWVTVCEQVNHLGTQPNCNTKVNSA